MEACAKGFKRLLLELGGESFFFFFFFGGGGGGEGLGFRV